MNLTTTNLRKLYATNTGFEISLYKNDITTPLLAIVWDKTISFRRNKKIITRLLLMKLYRHMVTTEQCC